MSDSTTSAGPPSMALSLSGAAGSRKSIWAKSTPAIASMSSTSMATTRPLRADALCRHLAPAAGRGAEVDHARAGFQEMMLVVDLGQLEGGARAKALALGARHIGIVELALQPERGRQRALLGGLDPHLERALAAPAFSPRDVTAAAPADDPRRRPRASSAPACLRAGRGRRRAAAGTGNARRIASRMAQPASTRSARSAPMQGLATRSS